MEVNTSIIKKRLGVRALLVIIAALMFALVAIPTSAFANTNTLTIPVEQIFSIAPGVERDATFNYELRRLDSSSPLPVGAEGDIYSFTLTGSETQGVGPITFVHAGFFTYEVRSVHTPSENLILDDSIFTVVIAVRNTSSGGLTAEVRAVFLGSNTLPGNKVDDIIFEKEYAGALEIPGTDTLPVVKTVQGNPANDYTFTFRLEAQGDYPMPEGVEGRTLDITIDGSGREYFPSWSHSAVGTFTYTIREIPTDNSEYVFDTSVFTVTDTVTRTGNTFSVERTITTEDNRQVTSMTFINTYVGTDVEVQEVPPAPGVTTPAGPKPGP
ncbi:MAG: hypothetical protein FWE26_03115, partial [Coriobacteriia bacterium]|nr:hypothetical protein [Coriobacteriia bacterium]